MLLLDIGGWTVDLMRIDNGRPIIDTCHSLEFGMIRCIDEVRERVRQNTGLSLTDAQIEQVLAGRPCSLEESVRSLIREQGRFYTERLLSAVLEAGFDYHALPVVMMGGGASVVSRHVRPVRLSASASISLRETARDLESPAGAFIAERPVNSLCRTVTLLDGPCQRPGVSPFECLCRNFILPEICKPCLFIFAKLIVPYPFAVAFPMKDYLKL